MRYLILLSSVAIQLCLGGIYAWSTFVTPLKSNYGLSSAQTQIIFGLLFGVFTGTMVFAGKVLERYGPRWLVVSSGLLFVIGYLIAANSGGSFWLLLLGISVLGGAATGTGYACPISTCVKWFPHHKGLVTGVAVAGFGAGAVLVSFAAEAVFQAGHSVLTFFGWMGALYGFLILISGFVMRFPQKPPTQVDDFGASKLKLATDFFFWAQCVAIFCGTFAGLMIVGNLSPLAQAHGISATMAAIGVSALAIGNGVGRIIWGQIVDKIGIKAVLPSLAVLALFVVLLIPATITEWVFIAIALLMGVGFGACFVVYAALTAERYGVNRVGDVYPLILLFYGLAGVTGPMLGGWLRDVSGAYLWSVLLALTVLLLGMGVSAVMFRYAKVQRGLANNSSIGES